MTDNQFSVGNLNYLTNSCSLFHNEVAGKRDADDAPADDNDDGKCFVFTAYLRVHVFSC